MIEEDTEFTPTTIIVVNIKYHPTHYRTKKLPDTEENYPSSVILDLPDKVLSKQNDVNYYDIVESFVYNTVSGKFGREVIYCQTYFG